MEVEAEIKKNKADYETDINFRHSFYIPSQRHKDVIRNERIQEILEKDLNRRLVKVDNLEDIANIDGAGVKKQKPTIVAIKSIF